MPRQISLTELDEQFGIRKHIVPPKKEPKKTDWGMITSFAICAITGLVAAFAGLTLSGIFPIAFFGGSYIAAMGIAFIFGALATASGTDFYNKWQESK